MILDTWESVDNFIKKFKSNASSVFGSGWTWLVINKNNKLEIVNTENEDNPMMNNIKEIKHGIPVICIDLWEHAYYLKYQNKRNEYIDDFIKNINWGFAEKVVLRNRTIPY